MATQRKFVWNEHKVCTNPINVCVYKNKWDYISYQIAEREGKWYCALSYQLGDGGGSAAPGYNKIRRQTIYNDEVAARRACLTKCLQLDKLPAKAKIIIEALLSGIETAHVGKDRTDRQRIKRKVARWVNKFARLPKLEQNLIFEELSKKHSR